MNKIIQLAVAELIQLAVAELRIHPTAQRDGVNRTKIAKFVREMDLDAIGTIHVVRYEINGTTAYWVIDGQHRVLALLKLGMGEWLVSCELHTGVTTDARASDLFLKLNDRTAAAPFEKFRNELQARRSEAVAIADIAAHFGLTIHPTQADGHIACISTLKAVYALDEGKALTATIATATGAWGKTAGAVEGKLIEGLGRFFATYPHTVDRPALVKKLAKFRGGPAGLLGAARGRSALDGQSVGRSVAALVVEMYDRGRSAGALSARTLSLRVAD